MEYRLDRILKDDEIHQLNNLLVPSLKDEYPNFEGWLDKAKNEIKKGSRLAIGIWKEQLIATIIIKFTASDIAELKSFFVNKNFRNFGYATEIYKEMERQCRKADKNRIITDVYCDKNDMVGFLLSQGFIIGGKDDLYGNKRASYIMSKTLSPLYNGDPYDWENLGEWFLNIKLNAIKVRNHPTVNNRCFDREMKMPLNNFELKALVEIKDQKVDMDPVTILQTNCTKSNYHLPIFIAREFTDRASDYADKNGVITFDAIDIEKLLGFHPPQFKVGPTAGMIVGIKNEYFKKLLEAKRSIIYIKGGPIGKYLDHGHHLAFYLTYPEQKIIGLGIVKKSEEGTANKIWELYKDKIIFTKDIFFRFCSNKKSILAIELEKIWEINPISDRKLDRLVPKKDRSGSYFDQETLNEFLKFSKT